MNVSGRKDARRIIVQWWFASDFTQRRTQHVDFTIQRCSPIGTMSDDSLIFYIKRQNSQKFAEKLENENVSLEEGIKLFEEGGQIAKECYTALNEAKGKIMQIKKDFVGEEEMK